MSDKKEEPQEAAPDAAKDAAKGKKDGKKSGKKKGKGFLLLLLAALVGGLALPATIVALPGLIPAWVMLATDRSRGRHMAVSVGVMNLAGVAAVVIPLMRKGFTIDYAVRILHDPANWVVMWGAAALGYALHLLVPPVVAQVLVTMAEFRAQKLKRNQEELKRVWGEEVKE